MIEIQNIDRIDKGSLLMKCDVYIKPWRLVLKEVKVFQKGVQRWIGMPSREVLGSDGIRKYHELIDFDSDSVKKRFREQILKKVQEVLETDPEVGIADPIQETEEMPF